MSSYTKVQLFELLQIAGLTAPSTTLKSKLVEILTEHMQKNPQDVALDARLGSFVDQPAEAADTDAPTKTLVDAPIKAITKKQAKVKKLLSKFSLKSIHPIAKISHAAASIQAFLSTILVVNVALLLAEFGLVAYKLWALKNPFIPKSFAEKLLCDVSTKFALTVGPALFIAVVFNFTKPPTKSFVDPVVFGVVRVLSTYVIPSSAASDLTLPSGIASVVFGVYLTILKA